MSEKALKDVSVEVMHEMATEHIRKWSCYRPYKVTTTSNEYVLENNRGEKISFIRPTLENWTIFMGLGKVLKDLIDDPGMHNTAMKYFGKKEIADLYNMGLIDVSGNPTDLGKKFIQL